MKISYNWLSEYLPKQIEVEVLSRILTGIGLEVEDIEKQERVPGGLEGLVIGNVTTCRPHPDADRLQVTEVDIGGETPLSIVCGAPNVAEGQKVVVAPVGTTLYPLGGAPFKIKKARLRGVASQGMICAEDEIGWGKRHEGIMVLPDEAVPGQPLKDYLKLPPPDYIFQIGLTPNRSDANSHLGVAADVCAYLSYHGRQPIRMKLPEIKTTVASSKPSSLPFAVEIKDPSACPRYAGLSIEGVTVAPAPEWLQQRLQALGIHPVNNIVDITNYILQLYGQPLHAFDYDTIKGARLVVRPAEAGSRFTTLDGKEQVLRAGDLLICNEEEPMCLAGIMGGTASGIRQETVNVFLESAYFEPRTIRSTSLHHGLRTDAATHFEKGVAMKYVLPALQHAAQLVVELAGGSVSPVFDFYPEPIPDRKIRLSVNYLNRLAGKSFSARSVAAVFQALGLSVTEETPDEMLVTVPGENPDLLQPADLVEEVIRIDGLDRIPIPERLQISLKKPGLVTGRNLKEKIAQYLASAGLHEIVTNSITNSKYYPESESHVRLVNTLSQELDILRPGMLESGLEVILYNSNRQQQNLALFEFGKTYRQQQAGRYQETEWLAIWLSGNTQKAHWQHPAQKADYFYLKGLLATVFRLCGLSNLREETADDRLLFHIGKQHLATLYKVVPGQLPSFSVKQPVFYAEVHFETLLSATTSTPPMRFRELPKYPSVKRDLALVLEKNIPYERVAVIVKNQNWKALKDFELFDIFENEKLGNDKKSLALSLTFQLQDRTLTDKEVDHMMQQLMQRYEQELNATVRS